MKRDEIPPPILGSDESSRRIRRALRAELDRRWGEIQAINTAIGHTREYLAKVCRGELPIKIDDLLLTLDVMGIDAGRFFANALGTRLNNDSLLEDLERFGEIDPRLKRIEKAMVQIERSDPPDQALPAIDAKALVAEFVSCNGKEQRRRLSHTGEYRHPAFAAAYLEHLDDLRYDDPKEARQNAEVMAVRLIPRLPGPQPERIALQLEAIGIYASALRQVGKFATAARALRRALVVARSHGLKQTVAGLLQRSAYVLSGHGWYSDSMELLNEALVIFFDLRSQADLGRVQVDRGTHLYHLGEYRAAVEELEHALELLDGDSARTNRNRLVAHQVLTHSFFKLQDLERAEAAAARAVAQSESAGRLYRGYLLWDHGVIALARHAYGIAEDRLREATQLLERAQDPNQAMVALDLTKTLVAQDKTLEAIGMAVTAAEYLAAFRGNTIAAAAVSELMSTVVQGSVSMDVIERVQESLRSAVGDFAPSPFQEVRVPGDPGR